MQDESKRLKINGLAMHLSQPLIHNWKYMKKNRKKCEGEIIYIVSVHILWC